MDEGRATGTGGAGGYQILDNNSAFWPTPKSARWRGGERRSASPPPTSAPSRRPCRRPRGAPPPLYFCRLRYFSLILFTLTLRPWILVPDARKMGFFQFHFFARFRRKKNPFSCFSTHIRCSHGGYPHSKIPGSTPECCVYCICTLDEGFSPVGITI